MGVCAPKQPSHGFWSILLNVHIDANSVVVLAGELLREAEKLVNQRIHPMTIIDGFRKATAIGRAALEASAADNSVVTIQLIA